jgi:Zn-finger nucleic acid-binding protein
MKCPVDGSTLVLAQRHGLEIDYCPHCQRMWLERAEPGADEWQPVSHGRHGNHGGHGHHRHYGHHGRYSQYGRRGNDRRHHDR